MTLEMLEGGFIQQYTHLRSYGQELLMSNAENTLFIKVGLGVDGPMFSNMYICFKTCKVACVTNCRPSIGLDS